MIYYISILCYFAGMIYYYPDFETAIRTHERTNLSLFGLTVLGTLMVLAWPASLLLGIFLTTIGDE